MPSCGVCPSVRLSVCHVRVFCRNEQTYSQTIFTIRQSHYSSFSVPNIMAIFWRERPNCCKKIAILTTIWLWDRSLLDRRVSSTSWPWSKLIALSGGVCHAEGHRHDGTLRITESCLWQQLRSKPLRVSEENKTELNCTTATGKSEAEETNNKRLRSRYWPYCTVEAVCTHAPPASLRQQSFLF